MSLAPGTSLGLYRIDSLLGAGGMGEVYRAKDTRLGRDVAIKILPASFAEDSDRRARFEREAQAIAALSHPNVVAIFDTGMYDRQAYVVMELLTGQTLRERLAGSSRQSGTAVEGMPSASLRSTRNAAPARVERVDLAAGTRTLLKELRPADPLGVRDVTPYTWRDDGREYVYSYRRSLCQLFSVSGVGR